jgi:SAM-dependent methyltransferase
MEGWFQGLILYSEIQFFEKMKFPFKEYDAEGLQTLLSLSTAANFNEWMYDTIKPYCAGKILEIGSGIGNISSFFIDDRQHIVLSDIRKNYYDYLKKNFSKRDGYKDTILLDIVHPEFDSLYGSHFSQFDTVFALNVVEHIYDDRVAINNAGKLLKEGGNLIILVPAYPMLYNNLDKELGHYRRYTRRSMINLLSNKFKIIHSQYFNVFGMLGWYQSGRVLKNKTIPTSQLAFFNKLVPFCKIMDKMTLNKIGLSVLAVGSKVNA